MKIYDRKQKAKQAKHDYFLNNYQEYEDTDLSSK